MNSRYIQSIFLTEQENLSSTKTVYSFHKRRSRKLISIFIASCIWGKEVWRNHQKRFFSCESLMHPGVLTTRRSILQKFEIQLKLKCKFTTDGRCGIRRLNQTDWIKREKYKYLLVQFHRSWLWLKTARPTSAGVQFADNRIIESQQMTDDFQLF